MLSSRSSSVFAPPDNVASTWQLVSIDNPGRTGRKHHTPVAPVPLSHRRGQTEGFKRLSIFKTRSRSYNMATQTAGYNLPPSSTAPPSPQHEKQGIHSQPGWSDSHRSDSLTMSWVAKGSKIWRKQNSKFNVPSSRTMDWLEEYDERAEQHTEPHTRYNSKHGRMWSTGNPSIERPNISQPFNFKHLTHTEAHQFQGLHRANHNDLVTEFSAIRASQAPQRELQGIRAEDLLKSPASESSLPVYHDPVTPPCLSPTKARVSRAGSVLSIKKPLILHRSRSIDNFSQPSPKAYKGFHSPTSPPPRTSSQKAVTSIPDFFSDHHHASPEDQMEIGAPTDDASLDPFTSWSSLANNQAQGLSSQNSNDVDAPHAITTLDDVALTLKPAGPQRNTIALADVPEEAEMFAAKKMSLQSTGPAATQSTLRHANSFPSPRHQQIISASRYSAAIRESLSIEGPTLNDSMLPIEDRIFDDIPIRCRLSRRISTGPNGNDACWEDDIDYCYEHEAEADCDFEWDRISVGDSAPSEKTQTLENFTDKRASSANILLQSSQDLRKDSTATEESTIGSCSLRRLPSLQTSIPDLGFSSASSTQSSMASLHQSAKPLQPMPLMWKSRPPLQTSKSSDTFSTCSSFLVPHDSEAQWTQEDFFQDMLTGEHSEFQYALRNINHDLDTSNTTSARSSGSPLSKCNSSDSIILSQSASVVQRRRNNSSSGSLPDLVHSKPYRQPFNISAEEVAQRIAALSSESQQDIQIDSSTPPKQPPSLSKEAPCRSILKKTSSSTSSFAFEEQEDNDAPVILPSLASSDQSKTGPSFANRMRSGSVASTPSGASSQRTSRVSYSLYPAIAPLKPSSGKQLNHITQTSRT